MSLSDHYSRLISIGRDLLSADADVERMRRDCVRHGLTDKVTAKAAQARRNLLCRPIRDRLHADTLELDDLALLRCFQEIAFVRDEAISGDAWSEVPGAFDDVVSAVDHAVSAEMAANAEPRAA